MTLQALGKQNEEDFSFVSSDEALDFITKINNNDKLKPNPHFLIGKYDDACNDLLDLVE